LHEFLITLKNVDTISPIAE